MTTAEQQERNRERQQKEFEHQQELAAETRPDLVHRTLLFLLSQAVMNNRDCKREADYFSKMLDLKFTDPERLEEEHGAHPPGEDEGNGGGEGGEGDDGQQIAPQAIALAARQSRRFQR